MLKHLKLRNYRQHRDLTVHFGAGLNTIRGANEAGKTTLLEAIVYAFFGSRALGESLEDVVTYGVAVGQLRVDLAFEFLGIEYELYRAKSGCELSFGEHKITGQNEVTKYMESLFKVNAEMAGRLMLAEQTDLRGILNSGATAAGKMMEYLANFDLLDRIIELVQTKLSSGNTDITEARIAEMEVRLAAPDEAPDVAALEDAVLNAKGAVTEAKDKVDDLQGKLADLDVNAARGVIQKHADIGFQLEKVTAQHAELERVLAQPGPMPIEEAALADLREQATKAQQIEAVRKLHQQLKATNTAVLWDEPYDALVAERQKNEALLKEMQEKARVAQDGLNECKDAFRKLDTDYQVQKTKLQGRLIKETACAFCQKDLKDIPEVTTHNEKMAQALEALNSEHSALFNKNEGSRLILEASLLRINQTVQSTQDTLRALDGVTQRNGQIEALYARCEAYIALDRSVVPAQWTWTGPDTEGELPDYAGQLASLEARDREYHAWAGADAARRVQYDTLRKQVNELSSERDRVDVIGAHNVIKQADDLRQPLVWAQEALASAQAKAQQAETALSTAVALAAQAAKQRALLQDQLKKAQADLKVMQENNTLIKKIRGARPVITTKLWNLVLAAVSKDLTAIRGIPSTITRDEDRFLVNGNPAKGLSGSAKDSLGLAIRVALTKTFLPNVSFMSLDEPAAACSDEREVSMLGLLATTGFDQILLVTHSDLADSFSNHVINI